ncbi:hypothetical protein [Dasineura jujubifolia toursvirus 2a]|nr:hypothetical protein [Dasineura jujubifolia toursvirus 2a]
MQRWKYINTFFITLFHIISVYALFEVLFTSTHFIRTALFILFVGDLGGFGVTAGVHRLWCHRAYKAHYLFRTFLALCFSIAGQNTIYEWVRDHRVHHKFSDTDADPHNAKRGFWFSHVGWLMMTKHEEVIKNGKVIDMSDVVNDPVVIWHNRLFIPLKIIFCFILPVWAHMIVCNENLRLAIMAQVFLRYAISLNFTWLVNSAAHLYGDKPFDKDIYPSENKWVSMCAIGEGWHNYHHVFPYDYKAAELGNYSLNLTTMVLDFAAYMGWIYNLKEPSKEAIIKVANNKGNGNYSLTLEELKKYKLIESPDGNLEGYGY